MSSGANHTDSASGHTDCQRCGTCCRQGGPALHSVDLELIRSGRLGIDDLVTVRRGELAFPPLGEQPEVVRHEFLKLRGTGASWCCLFYDEGARGCSRYPDRPLACRVLDCRNTRALLELAGRDLLTRFDCLAGDDPQLALARGHEAECPCPDLDRLRRDLGEPEIDTAALLAPLEARVRLDLDLRSRAVAAHRLSLERELFLFGRPLFQLLAPLGIGFDPASGRLHLVPTRIPPVTG